ncbi:MAG: hypothetical protein GQ574_08910 [Crocinitomix sp.]|nr:hypothetical protein [Crocinitomix sp.]
MKLFAFITSILFSTLSIAHPHAKGPVSLDYTFEKSANSDNVIQVNATITNHSDSHFYFLSQSCNGLDYYITTTSPKATVFIFIHCNQSVPQKMTIAPNATYAFTTRITCTGNLEKVGLNLALIQVSKYYVVDEKFISKIEKEQKMNTLLLSGPVLAIPR